MLKSGAVLLALRGVIHMAKQRLDASLSASIGANLLTSAVMPALPPKKLCMSNGFGDGGRGGFGEFPCHSQAHPGTSLLQRL